MKIIIPDGRTDFSIEENIISVKHININKIIVVDQHHDAIGILTETPGHQWFVTDLLKPDNCWPTSYRPTAREALNIFRLQLLSSDILQFDSSAEFVRWLAKRLNVSMKETLPRKRDSKGRFCKRTTF